MFMLGVWREGNISQQSADLRALTFLLGLKIVSLNSSGIQLKMRPNQNVEENKSALELNFTLQYNNFDFEYLTEPYCSRYLTSIPLMWKSAFMAPALTTCK